MKKIFLSLSVGVLISMVSCGNSVDSKIDKFIKLNKEGTELMRTALDGNEADQKKLEKIEKEMTSLYEELQKENLTPEQQSRLLKAAWGDIDHDDVDDNDSDDNDDW